MEPSLSLALVWDVLATVLPRVAKIGLFIGLGVALADLLVSFNGKRFDVPFLQQSFDLDGALDRPHLDLMYPCRQIDLTGGLKQIEKDVGIQRDRPDLSGKDAVRLWYEAERGDDAALETLISYNREDVDHLETVADQVVERLHERTVPDGCDL